MILFPLMTIWMWFQILQASPNLAFVPHRRERKRPCSLIAPFHLKEAGYDSSVFPLLQHE